MTMYRTTHWIFRNIALGGKGTGYEVEMNGGKTLKTKGNPFRFP
jgi:hypothetical protein